MEHTMHSLKTDPQVFEAVLSGKKTYEIRKNDDRRFKVGDFLRLMETQHTGEEMRPHHDGGYPGATVEGKPLIFTGRTCLVEITHILEGPIYGLMTGWSLLSISLGEKLSIPADPRNGKPLVTNAMKAECIGEFHILVEHTCPICYGEEPTEDCEVCGGNVSFNVKHDVPWDTMKDIYKMMAAVAVKA